MRIFGGMEHLTPRRSGRSKNDAAAGATDRKKQGRGVKGRGEIEGMNSLSYLYSDAEPVYSPACEISPGLYFLSFPAHRVIFTPLACHSTARSSPDFYGDNPPTRDRATDTCFVRRRRTLPRVPPSALRKGKTVIARRLFYRAITFLTTGTKGKLIKLID